MADTLYAFTRIVHGTDKGEIEILPGQVIDRKLFTPEQLIALVENQAVSRFNRIELEQPEITVADLLDSSTDSEKAAEPPKP